MQKKTKILAAAILIVVLLAVVVWVIIENNSPIGYPDANIPNYAPSPCERDAQLAINISSSAECKGKEFRCVGGGISTTYYNSKLTKIVQTEIGGPDVPEEVENLPAAVARISWGSCDCAKPVSYMLVSKMGTLSVKESCEGFYRTVQDYNASCGGCLLSWVATYE